MNHRAKSLACIFALLLTAGACGGDAPGPAPKSAPAQPVKEVHAPQNDSPIDAANVALASDLSLDNALDTLLDAAKRTRDWASKQREAGTVGEALKLAAQLELTAIGAAAARDGAERPTSSGVDAFEDRLRGMSSLPEMLGEKHEGYQSARRVAEAGLVALSTNADVKDIALDLGSARTLALSTTNEGLVIRAVWMARIESALQSLASDPPELQVSNVVPLVGRLLCNRCSDAHHITPEKVTHFLLNPSNSGGIICDTALQVGRTAKQPPMEIAAISSCERLRLSQGASEPTLLWGTNAIVVGALHLATELAAAPIGTTPLSPLIAAQSKRLQEALKRPIRLPNLLPSAPIADGDIEAPWNASMMELGKGGSSVSSPSDAIFFASPENIRVGLRPTVAIEKDLLVSRSAQLGLPAGGKQIMSTEALSNAELNADTGIVAISSAVAELREAIPKIKGDPNLPVELVVDARTDAKVVKKLLDALKLAGVHHVRFVKTATHGQTLPLLVRDEPPGFKERFGEGTQSMLAVVTGGHVDVWLPRGVKEKKSGDLGKFVKQISAHGRIGYRGKSAARIRVPLGTDGRAGLGAQSNKALGQIFGAAANRLKVGPVLHVIAGRKARAADVLGVSSIFQERPGRALEKPGSLWPGASCGGRAYTRLKRTPKGCATAVAVGFSRKQSPSNAGISEDPSQVIKSTTKPKKAEAGFCDKKDIAVRMKKRRGSFRFCYERELRMNKDLAGRVAMRFQIGPTGAVKGTPQVSSSTLGSSSLHKCLGKNIQKITFAKPDGGTCTVSWPFVFKEK